jgi:hypothetical protein
LRTASASTTSLKVRDHAIVHTLYISLTIWTGHRHAIRLLAEDPQREEQRQALLAQREALVKGQNILRNLQQKRYGHDDLSRASSSETVNHFGLTESGMPTPLSEDMDEM